MENAIQVEITRYDGDVEFPEAERYNEYVAEQLAERYPGTEFDVSYGLRARCSAQFGVFAQEVEALIKVELWDAFCADGYRQFA